MSTIQLYDATLRDGMGGGGMTLTAAEKVRVVRALDELGVDMIEAGFPASNPKELKLFELLEHERLQNAEIVAFGMTRRRGKDAAQDEGLRVLAESFVPVVTLVGKSSAAQAETVLKVTRAENLAMIGESIAHLVAHGKRVIFDAEHFFDGYREDEKYALECLRAAAEAGAERVVLCDTNGGSLPLDVSEAVKTVRERMPNTALGIHTHDDTGCGVANTIVAVQAGATQVQGTINGIGERTGNANLVTIVADLQLKLGYDLLPPERLARLTETAHLVDELLNRTPDPAQPYVGKHAFAHKAGMHAAGVKESSAMFEHVDPETVGNHSDVRSPSCRGGLRSPRRRGRPGSTPTMSSPNESLSASRARARGVPVRGGGRVVRAVDAQGGGRVRATVQAQVLAGDRRAARRRPRDHRGHDQDLGQLRKVRAHRRGERAGACAGPGVARRHRRDPSPSEGHRSGQLQGSDTRRDQGDRGRDPGADRCLGWARCLGVDWGSPRI